MAWSTTVELACVESRGMRRHEENGAGEKVLDVKLAVDKGGRGRNAAHMEAVLHGRHVEVAGGGLAARGERSDKAARALV
jgi:hypothetical protein